MSWTIPNTLTAGAAENVNDVTTNLNSLAADTEFAYSTYKHVLERNGAAGSATAQTYLLGQGTAILTSGQVSNGGSSVLFYIDPADYAVTGRTAKYRVRAHCYTNATAPAITFTVGLYPVSAVAGAGTLTWTPGTVTAGSTVAFTTQALSTRAQGSSGDFTAPAAGHYALGVVASGSQAASSIVTLGALLQVRQV